MPTLPVFCNVIATFFLSHETYGQYVQYEEGIVFHPCGTMFPLQLQLSTRMFRNSWNVLNCTGRSLHGMLEFVTF